ncbi:MAG: hypothetical protein ACR2P0_20590, partial [Acidimicrobiales bacterium]
MSRANPIPALVAVVPAAFLAAVIGIAMPLWLGIAILLAATLTLRPALIVLALLMVVGVRSHEALGALSPTTTRPVESEEVTLVADPRPADQSIRVEVDLEGDHVVLDVRLAVAPELRSAAHGDRLRVSGVLRGSEPRSDHAVSRRIVGRLDASRVHTIDSAGGVRGWATSFRRLISDGASSMSFDQRA